MKQRLVSVAAFTVCALSLGACANEPSEPLGADAHDEAAQDEAAVGHASEALIVPTQPLPPIQITQPIYTPIRLVWSDLIDFDRDPSGNAVAAGAVVDSTYTSWGASLTCIVCSSGHAYTAQAPGATAGTTTNIVTLFAPPSIGLFDNRSGAVQVTFSNSPSWVSIEGTPVLAAEGFGTPNGYPWLEAYDAQGNLIAKVKHSLGSGSGSFATEVLRIDSSVPIASARFSSNIGTGQYVYGRFDNLRYGGSLLH